jgi:DNA-binding GntR family transcriptional regulator
MLTDLKHRTLASAVVDRLREQILSNAYPAGTQLRQDALAASFGVSRIPVREALFQLEAEGLVQMVPHKGAVVTELSLEEVNDVFDLRVLLETRLFRDSLGRLTDEGLDAIDAVQARFAVAFRERDHARWGVLNQELHAALYARAALPQTRDVVAALLQKSDRYTRVQLSSDAARRRAEREHATLIALARARRIDEACAFLAGHIEAVRADLLRMLGTPDAGPRAAKAPGTKAPAVPRRRGAAKAPTSSVSPAPARRAPRR